MAGEGFAMDAAKKMKANYKLRSKRRSFKDISNDYKSKEMVNRPIFDKESQKEFARKDAIAFYISAFIIFSLSLALVMYFL